MEDRRLFVWIDDHGDRHGRPAQHSHRRHPGQQPAGFLPPLPGSYRMEATPKNPEYWTLNYEHPLADGAGEIRTNIVINPFTIEPSEKLTQWIQTESEAFAASCRTGTPDPARQRTCGALAFSTEPLDLVNDPPSSVHWRISASPAK